MPVLLRVELVTVNEPLISLDVDRSRLGNIRAQGFAQSHSIVRVNVSVMAGTGNRNVCQPAIHQLFSRLLGVNVNKDSVGGFSLAAMARHCIPIIEMRILFDIEGRATPGVESQFHVPVRVRLLYRS